MKKNIHPKYYKDATITCSCGTKYPIGSTEEKMQVEICSQCHPFFTGAGERILDVSGRVDKFKKRAAKSATLKEKASLKKLKIKAKKESEKAKDEEETTKKAK